jgi:hypothetical protein
MASSGTCIMWHSKVGVGWRSRNPNNAMPAGVWRSECHPTTRSVSAGELSGDGKRRWFCLAYFAPNRCRDQPPKRPVARDHALLPSRDGRCDARARRAKTLKTMGAAFDIAWQSFPPDLEDHEGAKRKLALLILRHMDQGECDTTRLSDRALLDFMR